MPTSSSSTSRTQWAPSRRTPPAGNVAAWLSYGGNGAVRVNAAGTPWHDADLTALAGVVGLSAVVVPMAEDPTTLTRVHELTGAPVLALVETARGILRATDLAEADGVARLAFAHLDFTADIDAEPVDEAVHHARSVLVLASRAAGLPGPVDGVTTNLDDESITDADARRARRLGMGGKLCIHPRQVEIIHRAFAPTAEQIAWAHRVLAAAAESPASAVRLVLQPHLFVVDRRVVDVRLMTGAMVLM